MALEQLEVFSETLTLAVNTETHELVLCLVTNVGTVTHAISKERAAQLGVSLIRQSGRRFEFKQEEVHREANDPIADAAAALASLGQLPASQDGNETSDQGPGNGASNGDTREVGTGPGQRHPKPDEYGPGTPRAKGLSLYEQSRQRGAKPPSGSGGGG